MSSSSTSLHTVFATPPPHIDLTHAHPDEEEEEGGECEEEEELGEGEERKKIHRMLHEAAVEGRLYAEKHIQVKEWMRTGLRLPTSKDRVVNCKRVYDSLGVDKSSTDVCKQNLREKEKKKKTAAQAAQKNKPVLVTEPMARIGSMNKTRLMESVTLIKTLFDEGKKCDKQFRDLSAKLDQKKRTCEEVAKEVASSCSVSKQALPPAELSKRMALMVEANEEVYNMELELSEVIDIMSFMRDEVTPLFHIQPANECAICKEVYGTGEGRKCCVMDGCGHTCCYTCATTLLNEAKANPSNNKALCWCCRKVFKKVIRVYFS